MTRPQSKGLNHIGGHRPNGGDFFIMASDRPHKLLGFLRVWFRYDQRNMHRLPAPYLGGGDPHNLARSFRHALNMPSARPAGYPGQGPATFKMTTTKLRHGRLTE